MLLCFYAFLNAVDQFPSPAAPARFRLGDRLASTVCIVCFGMGFYEFRAKPERSARTSCASTRELLDVGGGTSALLVAFAIGLGRSRARLRDSRPYADPVVLALLTLCLVFVPIRTVRKALQEILLITPPELDAHVRSVMDAVVARHGFKTYTS